MNQLEQWAKSVEIKLGPLIPNVASRLKVLQLLYTYRHLNENDLTDLPCTDLIVHRVCLKKGIKPASVRSQKRWPAHTEWWLRKLVSDGIQGGIYEHTVTANRILSAWNARVVLVDKVPNPLPTDKPRLTFDYHQLHEDLPGVHMELSAHVHDSLSDPRHGTLFLADLKHAYYSISLHPDDRHIFAFTIQGIWPTSTYPDGTGRKISGVYY